MEMNYFRNIALTFMAIVSSSTAVFSQTIMDVDTFRNEFNSLSDDLRVVITNDPDCGGCLYMVQQEFGVIEDPNGCGLNEGITYIFNWTKVLGGTTAAAVDAHTTTWSHPRYIHYWDETQILGDLFLSTLGLVDPSGTGEYTAWHTILCYEPGVEWNESDPNPPMPTYWLHKLSEQYNADQSLYYTDSLFNVGFNALACLTSLGEQQISDKVTINGNGSNNIVFNFIDVEKNAQLRLMTLDGRTAVTYPINTSNGFIELTDRLGSGMYVYSLIENGKVTGSDKLVIIKNH